MKKILSKVVLKADEKTINFGTNIWQHSWKLKCDPTFRIYQEVGGT